MAPAVFLPFTVGLALVLAAFALFALVISYVYMYVWMDVCFMYVCKSTCMYEYMYVSICVCVYLCIYVGMSMCILYDCM